MSIDWEGNLKEIDLSESQNETGLITKKKSPESAFHNSQNIKDEMVSELFDLGLSLHAIGRILHLNKREIQQCLQGKVKQRGI
jgi:hypothetical protein